jgi:hypothetical protein
MYRRPCSCGNAAHSRYFLGEVLQLEPVSCEVLIRQKSRRERLNIDVPTALLIIPDFFSYNSLYDTWTLGVVTSHTMIIWLVKLMCMALWMERP